MTADGLADLGYDVRRIDLTPAIAPQLVRISDKLDVDPGEGPVIIVVNPPETLAALASLGKKALRGRTRIGYWVYELETAPRRWADHSRYFHHIWAPSPHAVGALRGAGIHADMVPYPIYISPDGLIEPQESDVFTVISFADTQSSLARKNPMGSIEAFQKAFADVDDVALIIKLSNAEQALPETLNNLKEACESDPRIQLNMEIYTRANVASLLSGCDVFLSLHRAEGYGLLVVEALLQGLDAVFTSGTSTEAFAALEAVHLVRAEPCLIQSRTYKSGAWLEPDIDVAAELLRAAYRRAKAEGRCPVRRAAIREAAIFAVGAQGFERSYGEILTDCGLSKAEQAREAAGAP